MSYFLEIDIETVRNTGLFEINPVTYKELAGFTDDKPAQPIYKAVDGVLITRVSDGDSMGFDTNGKKAYCCCSALGTLAAKVRSFIPAQAITTTQ